MQNTYRKLARTENQVRLIAQYAIDFLSNQFSPPSSTVLDRVEAFHRDSVACGVAALAIGAQAPVVLRQEALEYPAATGKRGAYCFGSTQAVKPEKAVLANSSAVRELDSNGTNFGYNLRTGHERGEFGHNDFYPVVLAAAQQQELSGEKVVLGMLCLDEIRGRLAEVFGLKDYKIDHVVHGAIASAAVYGALMKATVDEIESAIGQVVAHYIPFRAIRAGHQLSDSKGASAAISAEMAVTATHRAMRGFIGPQDIFRNPQAIFLLFEPTDKIDEKGLPLGSPFDLELATEGDDFAIMDMHFKLGLYEHQSAGAIAGLLELLQKNPTLLEDRQLIDKVEITIYEPAYGIIGDPAKRNPTTRQSADHSMVYIIATLLRKAFATKQTGWKELFLSPDDYSDEALVNSVTREWIEKITFRHGGKEFDEKYPKGIPTLLELNHCTRGKFSSGLVMYPPGHARNESADLDDLLENKFVRLASLGVENVDDLSERFRSIREKSPQQIADLYSFPVIGFS
ncbi:MAG: MmgE/PrpD family protein [Pirellulaceae bacterium]|nr:MmgE/PrpD family protein [Pirellulaceae bacterium]